jgi:hypothetical protein
MTTWDMISWAVQSRGQAAIKEESDDLPTSSGDALMYSAQAFMAVPYASVD